jgi:peptidylprolyl isomerase
MSRTALLTAGLCGVLALSACGGDDSTASSTTTPSAAPETSRPACPISTTPGTPDESISKDLATKPVAPAHTAPEPAGIVVADVVVGTGQEAKVGDTLALKYAGTRYVDGVEFDSSWSRSAEETISSKACYSGTVPGFSVGPLGMKVGGRREIIVPGPYGYPEGSGDKIPPNAPLVFVVDLVSVS